MPQVTRPAASTRLRSGKRLTSAHQNPKRLRRPSRFPLYVRVLIDGAPPSAERDPGGSRLAACFVSWGWPLSARSGALRDAGSQARALPLAGGRSRYAPRPLGRGRAPRPPPNNASLPSLRPPSEGRKGGGRGRATAKPWKSEFVAKTSVQMILKSRTSWLLRFLDACVLTWLVPAVYQGQCLWRTEIKPVGVLHYKMERRELAREWTEMFVVFTIIFPNFPFNCEDQIQKTSLSPCLKTHGALAFKHALYGNLKDTVHVLRTQAM